MTDLDEHARARRMRKVDIGLFAKPRIEMPGHSTEARRIAVVRVAALMPGQRGEIYRALITYKPMTRARIVALTGICENSVNARVSELVKLKRVRAVGIDPASGRSILEAIQEVSP